MLINAQLKTPQQLNGPGKHDCLFNQTQLSVSFFFNQCKRSEHRNMNNFTICMTPWLTPSAVVWTDIKLQRSYQKVFVVRQFSLWLFPSSRRSFVCLYPWSSMNKGLHRTLCLGFFFLFSQHCQTFGKHIVCWRDMTMETNTICDGHRLIWVRARSS